MLPHVNEASMLLRTMRPHHPPLHGVPRAAADSTPQQGGGAVTEATELRKVYCESDSENFFLNL